MVCRFDAVVGAQSVGSVHLQGAGKRHHRVQVINTGVRLSANLQHNHVVILKVHDDVTATESLH